MDNPDFWDFIFEGGLDLLFPDDERRTFDCPFCKKVILGCHKVEWVDKNKTIFRCPECRKQIQV